MTEQLAPITLTIRQIAQRLQVGKSTAHRLVTTGAIPGFRVSEGSWRVLTRDFDAYVERKRAEAEAEYRRAREAS